MNNLGYLSAAYSVIFAAIFLYVVFVSRYQARLDLRLRSLELQLDAMREDLASRLPPPSGSAS